MLDRPLPGRGTFLEIVSSLAALVSDGRFRNKKVISEREEPNDGSIGRRESIAPADGRARGRHSGPGLKERLRCRAAPGRRGSKTDHQIT